RRHTRSDRDWSSDVLFRSAYEQKIPAASRASPAAAPRVALGGANVGQRVGSAGGRGSAGGTATNPAPGESLVLNSPENRAKADRSEERRVGKEGRSRGTGE